jgi:NADH dehydrogenase
MAMVGRNAAVVQAGPISLTGLPAWIVWGVLHLAYLPGVVNRLSAGQKFLLWHLTHDTNARILLERQDEPTSQGEVRGQRHSGIRQ